VTGCSAATGLPETPQEARIKHLLFSNNPSGKTYFSNKFYAEIYLEDQCILVKERNKYYEKYDVFSYNEKDPDKFSEYKYENDQQAEARRIRNAFGTTLSTLGNYLPYLASRWAIDDVTRSRLKKGNAKATGCDSDSKREKILGLPPDEFEEQGYPEIRYFLTTQSATFDELWKQAAPANGFQSKTRAITPFCFARVEADADNNVRAADIHILMTDFSRKSYWSAATMACLARGGAAVFGMPGILDTPDKEILIEDFEEKMGPISQRLENGILREDQIFWRESLMDAARLYDSGGWTWPKVRQEILRLNRKVEVGKQ